jgi:hypothetical protein
MTVESQPLSDLGTKTTTVSELDQIRDKGMSGKIKL